MSDSEDEKPDQHHDAEPAAAGIPEVAAAQESSVTRLKSSSPSAAPSRARLDGDGRERPVFLLEFPADPELEKLMAAFERGDFRTVREQAPNLVKNTAKDDVRAAAEELLQRIEPDPLLKLFLWSSVGLLAFLAVWTYW